MCWRGLSEKTRRKQRQIDHRRVAWQIFLKAAIAADIEDKRCSLRIAIKPIEVQNISLGEETCITSTLYTMRNEYTILALL